MHSLPDLLQNLKSLFLMSYTYRILADSWNLFLELWFYLLIGIIFTAVFQAFIDREKLGKHIHRHPHLSVLLAAGFGVISPLGTYVCIPMAGSLFRKGTPLAPLMAFLVASPILNPTIFMLTVGAFGYEMAFLRLLTGFSLGVIAGYIFMIPGLNLGKTSVEEVATPQKNSTAGITKFHQKFLKELKGSAKYMLKYFSIAVVIAAAIKNLITTDQVNWLLGNGSFLSVVIATGAGIPLYSCGGAAIPVLYQLAEMGMTRGAILAFFISGPSTRISNLIILKSVFSFRILFLYLAIILTGAILSGFLYNLF